MRPSCHPTCRAKAINPPAAGVTWDIKPGIPWPSFIDSGLVGVFGDYALSMDAQILCYSFFRPKVVKVAAPPGDYTCTISKDFAVNGGGPLAINIPYKPTGGSYSTQLIPTWVNDDYDGATGIEFIASWHNTIADGSGAYSPRIRFKDFTAGCTTYDPLNAGDPSVGTLYFLVASSTITADIRGSGGAYGDVIVTVTTSW